MEEKKEDEKLSPLVDFSAEDQNDDYEEKAAAVKKKFKTDLFAKGLELILGIICIYFSNKTGVIGTLLFIAAIFYLIPDGLVKGIVLISKYRHYKDFVTAGSPVKGSYIKDMMENMLHKDLYGRKYKD